MRLIITCLVSASICGCSLTPEEPKTIAEKYTSYSYIPFDPLPVQTYLGQSCFPTDAERNFKSIKNVKVRELRGSFPDQTVRLAVAEFLSDGSLSFGPATIGYEGSSYQVVIDYMNTDTAKGSFLVKREVAGQERNENIFGTSYFYPEYKKGKNLGVFEPVPASVITSYKVKPNPSSNLFIDEELSPKNTELKPKSNLNKNLIEPGYEVVNLPVYVGVGLRLTATIRVLNGSVNLAGLPQIAAEAKAGNLSGTLVVQTLGATGELVSANLPLPNELNRTTVQTSILALGAIKALLPDESMTLTPRVVGIYNPYGGGQSFVNGVISALASDRLSWHQPCDYEYSVESSNKPK
ncbi:hypothetical protein [Shewanella japonica]|uniref:hypothetical protein n=1 Tax=Shewanella japonica TaxID=93973 RepID=UPI0013C3FD6C|nr:hypothetical protein [Shewanella japonica]